MDLYEFEQKIRTYIKEDGRSQAAVARKLGYPRDTFNKWVRCINRMPDTIIYEFCELLRLDVRQRIELLDLAGYALPSNFDGESEKPGDSSDEGVTPRGHSKSREESIDVIDDILTNLPLQLTSLIGREQEIEDIRGLLNRADVRLVTITGVGGCGKTHLALEVAQALQDQFRDGVHFISLASVQEPQFVATTIARSLRIQEATDKSLLEHLKENLRLKQALLLIDNFEHLISAAPLVSELLTSSSSIKIMVTSREVLRLKGEYEFSVPLLSVPSSDKEVSLENYSEFSAIELFVVRSKAVHSSFLLNDDSLLSIVKICERLDGIPLAIELAAAWVKFLGPDKLLKHVSDSFDLLQGGRRDLPERQQTLLATMDWSYELLNENERILFRRLAIFSGGRTLDAVEYVCNPTDDKEIPAIKLNVLSGLASLADKSLLQYGESISSETRFTLLATVHEFANHYLINSGEAEFLARRHAMYYVLLAEEAEPMLMGSSSQKIWLDLLHAEHDNLRTTLRWAIKQDDAQLGLRIAGAISRFWQVRGFYAEGCYWLQACLSLGQVDAVSDLKSKALLALGTLTYYQGDMLKAHDALMQGLTLSRSLRDESRTAHILNNLGLVANSWCRFREAHDFYEESLGIRRRLAQNTDIAYTLHNLGVVAVELGDYDAAQEYFDESLEKFREEGYDAGVSYALLALGRLSLALTHFEQAKRYALQSLSHSETLNYKSGMAYALNVLGIIAYKQKDYAVARTRHEASRELFEQIGNKLGIARSLNGQGLVAQVEENWRSAYELHAASLRVGVDLDNKLLIISSLEGFANLAIKKSQMENFTCLVGLVAKLRAKIGAPSPPCDEINIQEHIKTARSSLTKEAFAQAWTEGMNMPFDQTLEYALGNEK